ERRPITFLSRQAIGAEPPKQHIIRRRVLGMQLEPVALEPLQLDHAAFDLLGTLIADWVAEHRQTAVLIPIFQNPPTNLVARLGEEAAVGGSRRNPDRWRAGRGGGLATMIPIA